MLTCYVIDDESHAIKTIQSYIEKTPWLKLLGTNENPLDALSHFKSSGEYADITFLDLDMPQITGIELSSMLHGKTTIVFTTAHPGFAIQAFEMNISDYLLKPFSYERFLKCVNKLSDQVTQKKNTAEKTDDFFYFQTEGKGKLIKLFFKEIIYIESQKNYLSIVTSQKKHLTYLTLTEIEEKLPSSFIRISKSFIVNTDKISHVEGNEIFLANIKESFPVGASYKEEFAAHMKEHLFKSKRN